MSSHLPDINALLMRHKSQPLSWVGLSGVEMVLLSSERCLPAYAGAHVSLDSMQHRGIHMSRLYQVLMELGKRPLEAWRPAKVIQQMIETQGGLSQRARLRLRFQWPVERSSLRSEQTGTRLYPIRLEWVGDQSQTLCQTHFDVLYSSTCPNSVALSKSLLVKELRQQAAMRSTEELWESLLSNQVPFPTPHAQRSRARISVRSDSFGMDQVLLLINEVERVLGTPVQTFVKRSDEQEFAKLNGEHLMFSEDAARSLYAALKGFDLKGFRVQVSHFESLHPHNATAEAHLNWY